MRRLFRSKGIFQNVDFGLRMYEFDHGLLRVSAKSHNQIITIILLRIIYRQSGFAWQQGGDGGIEQLLVLGIATAVRMMAHDQFPVTAADRAVAHRV